MHDAGTLFIDNNMLRIGKWGRIHFVLPPRMFCRWLSLFPLVQTTTNAVAVVATMQYSVVPVVNIIFACGLLSIEGRCGYGWAAVRSPSGSGRKSGRNRTLSQRAVKWFESSSSGFASYFLRAHYVLFFIILFFHSFHTRTWNGAVVAVVVAVVVIDARTRPDCTNKPFPVFRRVS